jgi:hypothetical protein
MSRPLADEAFKLDDEFAHKIGSLVFNLLATHQPEPRPYISVTPHPDALNGPQLNPTSHKKPTRARSALLH